MTEPLSELLRIRITRSQLHYVTEAAAANGSPSVSDYIRSSLSRQQNIDLELAAIKALIVDYGGGSNEAGTSNQSSLACAIETLLLLRTLVPPAARRTIQAEMERIGIEPMHFELNKT